MKRSALRMILLLLCLSLTACGAPDSTPHESTVSTPINDTIKTTFDEQTGTLTVTGSGVLADLYPVHEDDWEEYDDNTVRHIVIGEGITHLSNAFNHLVAVESIQFPSTLHTIERSFGECCALESLTIPATVKRIANNSFVCCDSLEDLRFEGTIQIDCPSCFTYLDIETITIPDNSVYCSAFLACEDLKEITIGANVSSLDATIHDRCWDGFYKTHEDLRVYVCEPQYAGDPNCKFQCWGMDRFLPIIIPEGESVDAYRNTPQTLNPDWIDTSIDNGQMPDPGPSYREMIARK